MKRAKKYDQEWAGMLAKTVDASTAGLELDKDGEYPPVVAAGATAGGPTEVGREVGDTEKTLSESRSTQNFYPHSFSPCLRALLVVVGWYAYVGSRTGDVLVGGFLHQQVWNGDVRSYGKWEDVRRHG